MIPRTLVPEDTARPPSREDGARPRRVSTVLDERTLIPRDLPVVPLVAGSAIPSHVPLGVLGERTLVPRDLPQKPLRPEDVVPPYPPLSILDARVAVPAGLPPSKLEVVERVRVERFQDVLEPDVITAGEVNLLPVQVGELPQTGGWGSGLGSILFHVIVLSLLLLGPKLFPYRTPTRDELELARRQLNFIYLPPGVTDVPKEAPRPQPPSAKMRVDPRILRQVAPPNAEPSTLPGPPRQEYSPTPQRELPSAPQPRIPIEGTQQQARQAPQQSPASKPKEPPSIEPLQADKTPGPLIAPQLSPGKALEQSLRGAAQGHTPTGGFSDPLPAAPGVAPGGGGGGGGTGALGGSFEMLTPDEGVDFTNYLARLLASVKRNWYAVIPESARLGDRGRVVIQFRIMRDGNVPFPEPRLMGSSGKEPLDRAAMSAIHASNPFEPLPPAFSGPFIELRFTFLYNLPLNYQ